MDSSTIGSVAKFITDKIFDAGSEPHPEDPCTSVYPSRLQFKFQAPGGSEMSGGGFAKAPLEESIKRWLHEYAQKEDTICESS